MDKSERLKLKQLAVDAIVAYPYDHPIIPFAEALERMTDELANSELLPHCVTCTCGMEGREIQ